MCTVKGAVKDPAMGGYAIYAPLDSLNAYLEQAAALQQQAPPHPKTNLRLPIFLSN